MCRVGVDSVVADCHLSAARFVDFESSKQGNDN